MKLNPNFKQDGPYMETREYGASLRRDPSTLTEGGRGVYMGHHPAEGRGPWAEEGGPPYRESRTTRLGRVEPVERRAPTYKEELEQQIQEKQERLRLEKKERDWAEAKMEAEMKNYNPWGRGGCGAPHRDTRGDLITDLKQMHRQNEEAWLNPETSETKANITRPNLREDRLLPPINTVSGCDHVQTSDIFSRSFANQQTGPHWGQHLAGGRGPWAEEGGPPYRESRTTRLGRVEPVEWRAPTYQEELEQQIQEKQERLRLEKKERDWAEAKMEAEMKNYNPWGQGGCGAPLRDTRGDLITDLKQMHRQNENAWLNPETSQRKVTRPNLREDRLPPVDTVSGSDHVQTSDSSSRSFANQQTGAHWGQHLAEGRGPWAEEGGPPDRESRTTRLGRVGPVERRAPTYQEELEQQIQEKQERRRLEKAERDRAEAKLEAEIKNYDPWGRGGCGAPLRDNQGDLITDLKQMHRQNEEAWMNPETSLKKATRPILREDRLPPIYTVSGFAPVQTSMYARGNVFPNQPTLHQLTELDKYKLGLKKQVQCGMVWDVSCIDFKTLASGGCRVF
ncbi:uncharacterized protein LOC124477447 [Hypomesus transpacificus]|uniref:uncharacterized protein LOC124477447 n=1 Tax=Hypomesus transpacificus TaxID=137520 RepID=UPI001F07F3CC|nr:uncharacterized protein LOC124477447 [Hypomesus transpacificus]